MTNKTRWMPAKPRFKPEPGDKVEVGKKLIGIGETQTVYGEVTEVDEMNNYLVSYNDQ